MLKEEVQQVIDIARMVAKEEIALAMKPKVKVLEPEPEPVKAEVKHK
jgi:hypothetical protein